MIDVRDLQIGDWIEDGYKKAQVTSITCDGIVETTAAISNIEVVEPIKLTEDILVKNGFEDVSEEGDRIRLLGTFDENDNITFVNIYPATIGYGTDIPQLKVYYVHQLQHLLRLVGVQKEIKL